MQKSKKILAAVIAAVLLTAFFNVNVCADTSYEIVIDSVKALKTGYCEIIGHFTNVPLDTQIACLIGKDSIYSDGAVISENINSDNLAWIDQVGTGNNGTFLIQFNIDQKFSESTLIVLLGSQYNTEIFTTTIEIPELPPGIEIVEDNSVIYGRDAYYVPGALYKPDSIAESIAFGGNNIYYKIGGLWYDLMADEAVDNSFLVKKNATPEDDIIALSPRYYYSLTKVIELKYFEESN